MVMPASLRPRRPAVRRDNSRTATPPVAVADLGDLRVEHCWRARVATHADHQRGKRLLRQCDSSEGRLVVEAAWNDGHRFSGRVALGTGAGGTLGGAVARGFGGEGASVLAGYRGSREAAESVAAD